MDFLDSQVFQVILTIVVAGLGLVKLGEWLLKKNIDVVASKSEAILERIADGMEGAAVVARGAGLVRVADVIDEAADIPDELGDVCGQIADMVTNEDFTKEALLKLINEGKEVGVEGKDFWVKIVKKPE